MDIALYAKRFGDDLDLWRLRCQQCGERGEVVIREPVKVEDNPELLGLLGAANRRGRRMKKRGEDVGRA